MGVRWTGSSPRRASRVGEVEGEGVGDDGRHVGERLAVGPAPAQGGADAGHQLVHPERLGDVVVGALVEGLDLVVGLVAGGQHDDGHGGARRGCGAAPRRRRGRGARGRGRRGRAVRPASVESASAPDADLLDLVAAGAQVDPQGAADRGVVVDDEHALDHQGPSVGALGRSTTMVSPPPGVSSAAHGATHRLGEAARHGQPEPDAVAVRGVAVRAGRAGRSGRARPRAPRARCRRPAPRSGRRGPTSPPARGRAAAGGAARSRRRCRGRGRAGRGRRRRAGPAGRAPSRRGPARPPRARRPGRPPPRSTAPRVRRRARRSGGGTCRAGCR